VSFGDEKVQKVWEKGHVESHNDPNVWRTDDCSAWMKRDMYGNRESEYGWEVGRIDPNGGDDLSNLRPLHWKNYLDKTDGELKCSVTADGARNSGV
jgi:hypothetical protein